MYALFSLALSHIATYLNQYLKRQFDLDEDIVVVSNLIDVDGSVPVNINNKIVIFIFNIEKDYTFNNQPFTKPSHSGQTAVMPPLYINLKIVLAANFSASNYNEALKLLSASSNYFHGHPVFDHQNSPDLNTQIQKLILEFENLSLDALSSLWGMIGGKYLPSVVYKLRTIIMNSENISNRVITTDTPSTTVGGR